MSAYLPAPLPRIPEPGLTVSRRQPTRLVAIPPGGNRQLSEDHLSSILAKGQRFDSGDQSPPQPMDCGNTTAERERRLGWRHPVPSLQRRQWAPTTRSRLGASVRHEGNTRFHILLSFWCSYLLRSEERRVGK